MDIAPRAAAGAGLLLATLAFAAPNGPGNPPRRWVADAADFSHLTIRQLQLLANRAVGGDPAYLPADSLARQGD